MKLYDKPRLSKDDKEILGVCGGLAEYFDTDSFIIRLMFFLLACSFPNIVSFLVFYTLLGFLMKTND